ncbi:MAG: hypothetical protein KC643_23125, partial [Nitrospira sp.]|nr:hypothetical protein [Nitrospira sp.]
PDTRGIPAKISSSVKTVLSSIPSPVSKTAFPRDPFRAAPCFSHGSRKRARTNFLSLIAYAGMQVFAFLRLLALRHPSALRIPRASKADHAVCLSAPPGRLTAFLLFPFSLALRLFVREPAST